MDSGRHELVPFFIALEHIYRHVYTERSLGAAPGPTAAALEGLAYAVASLAPLSVYESDGSALRALSAEELAEGLFRDGGKSLTFLSGRRPLFNLAIRASVIGPVIAKLIDGFPAEDERRS